MASPAAPSSPASLLSAAMLLHKRGQTEAAIAAYRSLLSDESGGGVHQVYILLANLLLTAPAPSAELITPRRTEALALAERAAAAAPGIADARDRGILLARYGHLLMQAHELMGGAGAGLSAGGDEELEGDNSGGVGAGGGSPSGPLSSRAEALAAAVRALESAVAADAAITIAWRNLSIGYKMLGRDVDAERAAGRACEAAGGAARAPVDLLYRHFKALRRLGPPRAGECAGRLCDVLASQPAHALAAFWLRVTLASGGLPAGVAARAAAALTACEKAGGGDMTACEKAGGGDSDGAAPLVPHEYVRRLFDGYAPKFDEHLVGALRYRTPRALRDIVIEVAAEAAGRAAAPVEAAATHAAAGDAHARDADKAPAPLWQRCGDLGCGTGLAGLEFRPLCRSLAGCDLSPRMVDEARRRGAPAGGGPLYDALAVGEVESWLREACARGDPPFDLLLAADVLVYIGALEGVFAAAAAAMAPAPAGAPPALLAVSTESDAAEEVVGAQGGGVGFRLTRTGRCCHQRAYVIACAQAAGFRLRRSVTQCIRENAGIPVTGDLFVFERIQ